MRIVVALSILFYAAVSSRAETSVEIDLQQQTAYLLNNGRPVLASPISSGRYGHLTRTGSFKVLDKERTHYSSMYGKIVDARGNTIVADADMPVSPGGKFIPAPMPLSDSRWPSSGRSKNRQDQRECLVPRPAPDR